MAPRGRDSSSRRREMPHRVYRPSAVSSRPFGERAAELHASVPVVDLHGDVPQNTLPRRRRGGATPAAGDWLRRWRCGGVDGEGLTVGGDMPVSMDGTGRPDLRCREMVADAAEEAAASDALAIVRTVADLDAALGSHAVALLLHLE